MLLCGQFQAWAKQEKRSAQLHFCPCVQVAIDFVCAESVGQCLKLAEEMRELCKLPDHAATPAEDR